MRIIGGKHSGYRFHPPKNNPARPTTDIAKEGLFNTLNNYFHFENLGVLDLFGGTGSISYEFASRGCQDITLVERFIKNVQFVKSTATKLDFRIRVVKSDVFKFIQHCDEHFDVIFAGPPYPLKTLASIPDLIFEHEILNSNGWFILEHNPNHAFEEHPRFSFKKNYGTTIFSVFKHQENE